MCPNGDFCTGMKALFKNSHDCNLSHHVTRDILLYSIFKRLSQDNARKKVNDLIGLYYNDRIFSIMPTSVGHYRKMQTIVITVYSQGNFGFCAYICICVMILGGYMCENTFVISQGCLGIIIISCPRENLAISRLCGIMPEILLSCPKCVRHEKSSIISAIYTLSHSNSTPVLPTAF